MAFLQPSEPPAPAPGPRVSRGFLGLRTRQWLVVAAVVSSGYLLFTAVAVFATWTTLTRPPTGAELRRAADAEVAGRWSAWTVARIFPERVTYVPPHRADHEVAERTGVAPETGCAPAVDSVITEVLRRHGCRAVLRATYTDQLQGIVVTVGVVAFPDQWAAAKARTELPAGTRAPRLLRALPIPGTAASRFDDAARQFGSAERGGPYIVLTTAGQADGRPAAAVDKERPGDIFMAAPQLGHAVVTALAHPARPDCDSADWKC